MLVSAGDITIVDVNDGISVYTATVYVQQAATPSTPSGGTYNFSTANLIAPSGWVKTIPSGSAIPIWVSTYTFSTVTPSITITAATWSTPVKLVQDGARAPFAISVQMGSAAWSDTAAYNAIIAMANSGDTLKIGDRVTEYYPNSSSPTWVLTKDVTAVGNPGTWAAPGTLIDGNLIVSGTVTAAKIESTGLSIKDVNGNVILAAGSSLPFSQRFPNTSNLPADNATRNVFLGNWATATAYIVGDIVIDSYGYGWSCKLGHTSSAINTTPTYPTTLNTYWTLYTVKGEAGSSGIVIDLSNDTVVIPTDASGGNGVFTNATTTASIYIGSTDTSANWTFTQTASTGITSTASNSNRTVSVTAMTTDTGYIDFTATRSGYPNQSIRFTIAKAKAGSAGTAAIVNYIELQSSTIKKDKSGAFTPSASITFNAKQISGSSAPTTYSGIFKVYTLAAPGGAYTLAATSTAVSTYSYNYPITGVIALKVELYDSAGTTLYDNEIIPYITDGIDGIASYVVLSGEQSFKFLAGSATPTNTTIILTATLYGSLSTYDWEYWTGSAWANLSPNQVAYQYSLTYNATEWGSMNSMRIRCVSGSYSDEMTIVKLYDGVNGISAITGYLTNEVHTEAALSDGTGFSLSNAGGTFKVYNGITDVTTTSTFNVSGGVSGAKTQNGLTFTINTTTGVYTLSGTSWTSDTETFTVTATYNTTTITKVYSIDKSKKGATGTGGVSAVLTNETHSFPADSSGTVSSYTGSNTDIYVYEGAGQLTYDGVGTTAGTWKITTTQTNITVGTITDAGTYASVGVASGFTTGSDTANIVYTIAGTTLSGTTFNFNKTQTFTKSKTGVSGINARAVDLTSSAQIFVYNSAGTTPSPVSATLTATARNATGTLTYAFKKNGAVVQAASAANVYSYTPPSTYSSTADQMVVDLYENATLVATDTLSMGGIKPGTNGIDGTSALSGLLTNEAHVVSAAADGTGYSLTTATGTFKVYSGITDVTASSTFTVATATLNGLTLSITATTGVYTLSGTSWTSDAETFTLRAIYGSTLITKTFKISKSKAGSTGSTGAIGGTITITSDRVATFTATDGTLDVGQSNIILTANLLNITGATYAWTFSGFQTSPTNSAASSQTITSAQFGTSKGAKVTCTVTAGSSTYVDDISVVRLEKSTAAAGATVGASFTDIDSSALTLAGNATITGTVSTGYTCTKSSGTTTFDTQAYSSQGYTGNCAIRFKPNQTNVHMIIGLNSDPMSNADYTSIDYGFYCNNNGYLFYMESSTFNPLNTTYSVTDVLEIKYTSNTVSYIQNTTVLRTITVPSTTYYADSSIGANGSFVLLAFGQYKTGNVSGAINPANRGLYIANATVDTLSIAGNAVTVPTYTSYSGSKNVVYYPQSSFPSPFFTQVATAATAANATIILQATITLSQPGWVYVSSNLSLSYVGTFSSSWYGIVINGYQTGAIWVGVATPGVAISGAIEIKTIGPVTAYLCGFYTDSAATTPIQVQEAGLFVQGAKR